MPARVVHHAKGSDVNKEVLHSIIEDEYRVPAGADAFDLAEGLMTGLGSTDADLREGCLNTLWTWGQKGRFTDEQLIEIGEQMVSNLSVGLGDTESDSVYLRAFSALVLALVLFVDQVCELGEVEGREPFLEAEQVRRWFGAALGCLEAEMDLRGWTDEAGWAHSIAHMADALCSFARSRHLDATRLEELLNTVADKLRRPTTSTFAFDEDERLAQTAIVVLLRNELPAEVLLRWLDRLSQTMDDGHWGHIVDISGCDSELNNARVNVRNFLRSLYFQLHIGPRRSTGLADEFQRYFEFYTRPIEAQGDMLGGIVDALRAMDRFFYVKNEPQD
jgi:hypothetical protein